MRHVLYTKGKFIIDKPLYQWDRSVTLKIAGLKLNTIPEIHLCNKGDAKAIVKMPEKEDESFLVEIPNQLLEKTSPIIVYVCILENENFSTKYSFGLEILKREKPYDYIATDDEEILSYNALRTIVTNYTDTVTAKVAETQNYFDAVMLEIEKSNTKMDETLKTVKEDNTTMKEAVGSKVSGLEAKVTDIAKTVELQNTNNNTVFSMNGDIITIYANGTKIKTHFSESGKTITETTTDSDGAVVRTRTTTITEDGTISEVIT